MVKSQTAFWHDKTLSWTNTSQQYAQKQYEDDGHLASWYSLAQQLIVTGMLGSRDDYNMT